ncbi:hypothetical protein HQ325_16590 [Rhodococcus sp. BP-349]|uniref:hypothetical protein n=1 Tax=unclassified Rhodococcus (in: high G+C Gram-positive bacteria) TaxID=192944 RepID=UPI001C9AC4FC|nr:MULTISPECIES: hypothetical protein [unclassified Rhodococcus (in: high G+C Gram-positive bacteria)]MBY6540293.1 hypothetical protein [Rhodococcus sp. BP-363]MBY6545682.1 hypothetical protein [Rhodococcus sp. BP-369]MBY6564912.1 hypothetical protein [Rhodococcus sp. BP-370]MBY6578152.1 hypothetical protein [Rhodococcus sp. BP-364]MBY6587453.1 hypothetical protein [Rhodococcus sp. BP-358]
MPTYTNRTSLLNEEVGGVLYPIDEVFSEGTPSVIARACCTVGRDLMARPPLSGEDILRWDVTEAPEIGGWMVGLRINNTGHSIGMNVDQVTASEAIVRVAEAAQDLLLDERVEWPNEDGTFLVASGMKDVKGAFWTDRRTGRAVAEVGHLAPTPD